EKPAVSIIIPNYNTAEFIAETLDSVLAQTFTNYEIIVINDGAPDTDELKIVLEKYYNKIIFVDKFENTGTSPTRNFAVTLTRGDYLCFLDADDIWFPTFLEELFDFLNKNNFDMVYADTEMFGVGYRIGESFLDYNPPQGEVTRRTLIEGKCIILPSGSLIKKSEFEKSGGFDPKVLRTEDFDLWMRMIFQGTRIGFLRKILFKFRIRPGSGSGDSLQRIERCMIVWQILQKKLPFTEEENRIVNRNIELEHAALLRAKGRLFINARNWDEAKKVFRQARSKAETLGLPIKHRLKLSVVIFLLTFSPKLLLKVFKNFRSGEIEHMPSQTAR
ncbi:MAG: glycosyltransferase family A protein, partial [Pyrinomonadaceae bacterium]